MARGMTGVHPSSLAPGGGDPVMRDLPVTFLYTSAGTSVAHRRLRGLSSPRRIDPVAHMDELWVDGP